MVTKPPSFLESKIGNKKSDAGQRGKAAEKMVETLFKKWNEKQGFAYFRLPDARAARGFLAAQVGDFVYFNGEHSGVVEVKETKHAYRIAKDKVSQHAILCKLHHAGASNVILIHHSEEGMWRAVKPTDLAFGLSSWDLRTVAGSSSAEEALMRTGYFS